MKKWHKWTKKEHAFLVKNYRSIGDTKLAELFNDKFPKDYSWTKKQIEKRRNYFGLKRTKEEERRLRKLNNKDGRHFKAWDKRGRAPEGTIRNWGDRVFIKVNGKFVDYYRHISGAKKGEVARKFGNKVKVISKREHGSLNRKLWQSYSPELKQTVNALNKLKKILHGKED